jgi:hypothetical protein
MIDIPIAPNVGSSPINTNNYAAGVVAPQTQAQRADAAATRVVQTKDSQQSNLQFSQGRTLEAIKYQARMVAGDNPFLNDISFTVYTNGNATLPGSEYVIRFTDVSTGQVTLKTAPELFAGADGGALVNGSI